MSGRVSPHEVIAALYQAADDDRLAWLDELCIAAGFLRRCPCGAAAAADERCEHCGLDDEPDVEDFFDVYRCDPEVTVDIPPLHVRDAPLQIHIAATGGGTVGDAYADNDWIYELRLAGVRVCSGADLRCGAIPHTHIAMAAVLATHLADTDQVPALHRHRDRLDRSAHDHTQEGSR